MKVVMKGAPLAIALAISLASMTATAQDAALNTTIGPCVPTYDEETERNVVLCGPTGSTEIGPGASGNFVIGAAEIGRNASSNFIIGSAKIADPAPDAPERAGSSRNLSFGHGNEINIRGNGTSASTSNDNILLGNSINLAGSSNIAVGRRALSGTEGQSNIAIGNEALSGAVLINNGGMTVVGDRAGSGIEFASGSDLFGNQAGHHAERMYRSAAIGNYSGTFGHYSNSVMLGYGAGNSATLADTTALGVGAGVLSDQSFSILLGSSGRSSSGRHNIFAGHQAGHRSEGEENIFLGHNAGFEHVGDRNTFIGQTPASQTPLEASDATSVGYRARASTGSLSAGVYARADGENSTALGNGSSATADDSVAIGARSLANGATLEDEAYLVGGAAQAEVSFGNSLTRRRLTGVAAGSHAFDAVNVSQLQGVTNNFINWIGGGASFTNNQFMAPTFIVQGSNYGNVGDAFAAIDLSLTNINTRIDGLGEGGAGADGRSAYEVAIDNGFSGSEPEWLASLKGEQGDRGERGATGAAGLDGRDGRDGIDGTNGINGRDGRSAYEVAQDNGYSGSEPEWLESLHGRDGLDGHNGLDGANGTSAYEVAVENGFSGSESEWLASLRGESGPAGPQGPEGPAGSGEGTGTDLEEGLAVEYTDETQTAVRLNPQGEGRTRISNVAEGSSEDDAVNVSQMRAQSAQSVRISNDYTDARINQLEATWNDRWDELDGRIGDLDRRVARVGALNAALTMMAGAGTHKEVGQVSAQVGWGQYRSNAAFAVGLHARPTERSSLMIGFSHDGREAMGGVGYSWIID